MKMSDSPALEQVEHPKLTGPFPVPNFPDLSDSAPPMELRKPETPPPMFRTLIPAELPVKVTDSAPPLELPQDDSVPAIFPGTESSGFFPDHLNLDSAPPLCTDDEVYDRLKVSPKRLKVSPKLVEESWWSNGY